MLPNTHRIPKIIAAILWALGASDSQHITQLIMIMACNGGDR